MITLRFDYPTTGTASEQPYSINGVPCRDRRKARRVVRLTRRAIARLRRANPLMPTFVQVRFR